MLWPYTGEMFVDRRGRRGGRGGRASPRAAEDLREPWMQAAVREVLDEATLTLPEGHAFAQKGGKAGRHTEHLGYVLAEMQFLQRAYPGRDW